MDGEGDDASVDREGAVAGCAVRADECRIPTPSSRTSTTPTKATTTAITSIAVPRPGGLSEAEGEEVSRTSTRDRRVTDRSGCTGVSVFETAKRSDTC